MKPTAPLSVRQRRTDLSSLAEWTKRPSADRASAFTALEWPFIVRTSCNRWGERTQVSRRVNRAAARVVSHCASGCVPVLDCLVLTRRVQEDTVRGYGERANTVVTAVKLAHQLRTQQQRT